MRPHSKSHDSIYSQLHPNTCLHIARTIINMGNTNTEEEISRRLEYLRMEQPKGLTPLGDEVLREAVWVGLCAEYEVQSVGYYLLHDTECS